MPTPPTGSLLPIRPILRLAPSLRPTNRLNNNAFSVREAGRGERLSRLFCCASSVGRRLFAVMIRKEPARWRIVLQKRSRFFADANLRFAGNDALFEKRSIGS